jgi:5-methylcytosine-specific restriction endonuclease McrA
MLRGDDPVLYVTETNWDDKQIANARATHDKVKVGNRIFDSTFKAFVALGLPISQHQAFRKTLKIREKLVFDDDRRKLAFTVVPKELRTRRAPRTPSEALADQIRKLGRGHRTSENPNADQRDFGLSLDELRRIATLNARERVPRVQRKVLARATAEAIRLFALKRAHGLCEGCKGDAPFQRKDGSPFLEVHHVTRKSDNGSDHPANVIALCPNCHRRAHYAHDSATFNEHLRKKLSSIEPAQQAAAQNDADARKAL